MNRSGCMSLAAVVLASAVSLGAQSAVNPSGHWEGTIQVPQKAIAFEIDLARDDAGAITGTLGMPGEHITGLPLSKITIEGNAIELSARTDQAIKGVIAADGRSITGTFEVPEGSAPVSLSRTGEARIAPAVTLPRVAADLEGTWTGTLSVGRELRLVMTLANHADGTASGRMVNLDQGGITVPVSAITRTGSTIVVELKAIDASYTGVLNGTELTGTYKQGSGTLPLTLRRDGK